MHLGEVHGRDSFLAAYFRDIWKLRHFWLSLVRVDLRSRYRRSALGMGWSLLHPIAMTAVLCTVFHQLFKMDVREYGPFLMVGLAFWGHITYVTLTGCQCFYQGEAYIRQFPAPMAIYPLRVAMSAGFHFLLALGIAIVLSWCCKGFGNLSALIALVPALLLVFVLSWSMAIVAGVANVHFPDSQHLSEVGLQILFYMTPILYPPEMLKSRGFGWLVDLNPAAVFLDLLRQPILTGQFPTVGMFGTALALTSLSALCAGWLLVRRQTSLIFYL